MILLPVILVGVVVALLRGGSMRQLATLPFRLGWLAVLCLAAQVYVIFAPADRLEAERGLHALMVVGSYALLVAVVWFNRRLPAMPVIGLGLILNLVVILANGGFMPVSREATLAAGTRTPQEVVQEGVRLPKSKDVLLSIENTRLWFLSDTIAVPPPVGRVFSVGDLVLAIGVFALLQSGMAPASRRRTDKGKLAVPA